MPRIRRTRLSTILGAGTTKATRANCWYYVIQQTSSLYLPIFRDNDQERHFAGVFRDTWCRIPLGRRRQLVTFWRDDVWSHHAGPFSPKLELLQDWSGRGEEDVAICGLMGHGLRFYSGDIDVMPDNIVSDVIAHELAHVWLIAAGQHNPLDPEQDSEYPADYQMAEWGFDPSSVYVWWHNREQQ